MSDGDGKRNDHGGGHSGEGGGNGDRRISIKIDRETFRVEREQMTGGELRQLPTPPIGPDRDLFQVVPGGSDRKLADDTVVKLKDGMRFFTAPAQINPGLEA